MNDPEEGTLKSMISQALENCHDVDLLDLIYKLIISETTAI
jgi:hypothetical protein